MTRMAGGIDRRTKAGRESLAKIRREAAAQEIVTRLFGQQNYRVDRLVQVQDRENGAPFVFGGWCREAITKVVVETLASKGLG